MNILNRRGFVKTILATAATSSPAFAALNGGFSFPTFADADSSLTNLESGAQQLRLSPVSTPLTFQNFVLAEGQWKPATLPRISFVTGASFPLVSSHVRREGQRILCDGIASAGGGDGKPFQYEWTAGVSTLAASQTEPWFRFRTTLHLPKPIRLQQDTRAEPQIVTWMTSTCTMMEGQSANCLRVD